MLTFFLFIIISLLHRFTLTSEAHISKARQVAEKIHVALAVDSKSARDGLIVATSVVNSAFVPENVVLHVVTTGVDMTYAETLATEFREHLKSCLPVIASREQYEVKPFVLPRERGFGAQLERRKTVAMGGSSHWNSDSGADMVRFYLPEIFSHLERILYIDNDVIVSCCLEEIWSTYIPDGKAVGIALDDLKWATTTQFQRHYNASHPVVYNSIRRSYSNESKPLSQDEFLKALPRYPNDGVLLFDVQKYVRYSILANAEEVAMLNNKDGVYVVGLGTQQFTVLSMHDKWVELTPRANLRRFPDMARGYLMWFYYNGFVHSAGQHKPRKFCSEGSDNEHQRGMYTSWVTNVRYLSQNCPSARMVHNDYHCASHLPTVSNHSSFMMEVKTIISKNDDKDSYLLKIGPYYHKKTELTEVEIEILNKSKWSGVVFQSSSTSDSSEVLNEYIKEPSRRSKWLVIQLNNMCDSSSTSFNYTSMLLHGLSSPQPNCSSILDSFKEIKPQVGKKNTLKHWQAVGIVVDMPYQQRVFDDSYSVGVLDALDMTFLRPKFILVKIESNMDVTDNHLASEGIMELLKRHGYTVGNNLEDTLSTANSVGTKVLLVWGVLTTKWL